MSRRPRAAAQPGVTSAASRLAARRRAQRLGTLGRILAGLLAVALVGGLGWVFGWSSWLAVDRVRVNTETELVRRQVLAVTGDPTGTPLARIDTDAVEARVAQVPAVASVEVRRGWPGTLVVEVEERRPAAALVVEGGYRLVDPEGVTYRTVARRPKGVPRLQAADGVAGREARAAAVAVLDRLPRAVRSTLREVRALTPDDITLVLADEVLVRWGSPQRSARKAEVLRALLNQRKVTDVAVYDVSAPDLPTVRVRD